MSENLNRSNPDFSKYDSMSIGELAEILRADAMGPERDDSDVDEILYVMEVLAKKRRQNGIAGKTAFEAYQEFQQHYLPMAEEKSKPRSKTNVIPFRRIAAVAASLVLVFTLATSANAFSFTDIWNAVARWAEETFSFYTGTEVSEPKADTGLLYESLASILLRNKRDASIIPNYIPDGYVLSEIIEDGNPKQESYIAIYVNQEKMLRISVQVFLEKHPEQVEMSKDLLDVYSVNGIDYYIFSNYNQLQAVWIVDTYECCISGETSVEEIKLMIDSIEKG